MPVVMTYFLLNMYGTQKKAYTEVDIHFAISTLKGSTEMTLSAFYYLHKKWDCSQRIIFDILCLSTESFTLFNELKNL